MLAAHGVERVQVSRFDRAYASRSPQDFIEHVLLGGLGHALAADRRRLPFRRAPRRRFRAAAGGVAPNTASVWRRCRRWRSEGVRVSSSAVRAALAAGRLAEAEALLGRPYSISGRVVHGDKLGRQIGYPTANVQLRHNRPPLSGIFAVRTLDGHGHRRDGAASLGLRPTVDDSGRAQAGGASVRFRRRSLRPASAHRFPAQDTRRGKISRPRRA